MGRTLSHLGCDGRAPMIGMGGTPDAGRETVARGAAATLSPAARGRGPAGDVFDAARIAGIPAAVRLNQPIPLRLPSRSRTPRSTSPRGGAERRPGGDRGDGARNGTTGAMRRDDRGAFTRPRRLLPSDIVRRKLWSTSR